MIKLDNYEKLNSYFSKKYNIKMCSKSDYNKIIRFIDCYWKKNHSLVLSKKLMDWQHYDSKLDRYNFAIAEDKKDSEIDALIGFIQSSQYDVNIKNDMIWTAIWKNREEKNPSGIGVMLFWYLLSNLRYNYFGVLGISDMAITIYNKLDYLKTGLTIQWYMLNTNKTSYSLVSNYKTSPKINSKTTTSDCCFEDCDLTSYEKFNSQIIILIPPFKSKFYYINRYFKHPIYTYHATKICNESGEVDAIFFWRICEHENAKCIRIVDYFGHYDAMCGNCNNFQALMNQYDAEFIDFINVGINHEYFEKAGFIDRSTNDIIVANYFEPFLLQNVDTRYAWYSEDGSEPLFFKGDADQDRPSIIKEEKDD